MGPPSAFAVGEFVPPMLAVTARAPFSSAEWWFEPKWDGFRAQVTINADFTVRSRQGESLLARFPALAAIPAGVMGPAVLDGEVVAWDEGRVNFHALAAGRGQVMLVAFDCLYDRHGWLLDEPWTVRRRHLEAAVRPTGALLLCEGAAERGEDLFRAASALGFEGVMAKRRSSPYWPGRRTAHWQKFLHAQELPVEVRALTARGGRWLGDVTAVGGWPPLARLVVPPPAGVGPAPAEDGQRVELPAGIAARVRHRGRTPGGRLRHAAFVGYGGAAR